MLSYFDSLFPPQRQYLDQLRASLPKQEMIAQSVEAELGLGAHRSVRPSCCRRPGQPPPTLPCPLRAAALPGGQRQVFLERAASSVGSDAV